MRNTTFLTGSQDPLLTALGVPHGHLVIEGCEPVEVICLTDARRMLKRAVDRALISGDTAAKLDRNMVAAHMLEDMQAVCRVARQHPMPKDMGRVLRFETAFPETPKIVTAMGQGRVVSSTNESFSTTITTLTAGFGICRGIAKTGLVRIFDVCTLLREMVAANLAADDDEYQKRWKALPEATRREIEGESRAAAVRAHSELVARHPLLGLLFGTSSTDE